MKHHLESLLQIAVKQLQEAEELPNTPILIQIEPTKDKQFGDYASNLALLLAKSAHKKPRDIAERLIQALPSSEYLQKVEVAGPGFINFFLSSLALTSVVENILTEKDSYGACTIGRGKRILLEFLSSNPTGPLHVGHGRLAAFGSVVANLLQTVGFKPYKEYYVNDAGRQMDILTTSVWVRYINFCYQEINDHGETPILPFPVNGYRGEYVIDIAKKIKQEHQDIFYVEKDVVVKDLPKDETEGGDKEVFIDALIERAKQLLKDKYQILFDIGCQSIVHDIRQDLEEFGVYYDNWFSEKKFVDTGVVDVLLEKLKSSGHIYSREGALWFRSTDFGDEKDRVLVRKNGQRTYFANDVAYHLDKFDRGYDIAIDIFGSDHHGYIPRMKAAIEASGINPERLINLLLQFVMLYRGKQQISMSTRGGSFVTLRELRNEVGNDAARFFYLLRKGEQHIDFDLDLAKAQSNENPLYYIQYAYARIASVFRQLQEKQLQYNEINGLAHINLLDQDHERQLLNALTRYSEIIINAALNYEPHLLTNYLRELAADFHSYYNACQFLVTDDKLRDARLALIRAVRQILLNGLHILGIKPPESM